MTTTTATEPHAADAPTCRCGAGRHEDDPERCAAGHVLPGNTAALVTGHRSRRFWEATQEARREIEERAIRDAGYDRETAPVGVLLAARTMGQAAAIQGAAFERVDEAGGPMTVNGRTRRSYRVWCEACAQLDKAQARLQALQRPTDRRPMSALEAQPEVAA